MQPQAIPEKDYRDVNVVRMQAVLKTILSTGVANAAPYLCLARSIDPSAAKGSTSTSTVNDIKIISQDGFTTMRVHISTDASSGLEKHHLESIIYTFRDLSPTSFEPFILISTQEEDKKVVFAYASDDEFLFEPTSGSEREIIKKTHSLAIKRQMRYLARYVDLLSSE